MKDLVSELVLGIFKSPIYWTVIILGFLGLTFYRKFIGFMGELWVKKALRKLSKKDYRVLNDIMIIDTNGCTHQIDHIIVSIYGIFVIETKNYAGSIYGKNYNEKWVQYLGGKKYYFHSPIRQNYGHIQALKKILNLSDDKFISLVVFSNKARLKVDSKIPVVNFDYLVKTIGSYKDSKLNNEEVDMIVAKVLNENIIDKKIRKEHVRTINNNLKN